jgi:hypothetical protein
VLGSKDGFKIHIVLRHAACSPESISLALAINPKAAWRAGDLRCGTPARWTYVTADLEAGNIESEFEVALTRVVSFLEKNAAYWPDFMASGGAVDLVLNHTISTMDEAGDKCYELQLAPEFLGHLSSRGIWLRLQGWQGDLN